jgi:hypothetical protein
MGGAFIAMYVRGTSPFCLRVHPCRSEGLFHLGDASFALSTRCSASPSDDSGRNTHKAMYAPLMNSWTSRKQTMSASPAALRCYWGTNREPTRQARARCSDRAAMYKHNRCTRTERYQPRSRSRDRMSNNTGILRSLVTPDSDYGKGRGA